ncbi:MAG TPA: serine hydrolase domain-containing protein [Verrucomicrobiales bacterium]|nr:serine hydrolase domain-containing protein [Verrucomicrobiales bacterium]
MKIKILLLVSITLALFTTSYAQTLDKAKLDQFFDRLAEKNKAMGSLTIAKDGKVLYSRAIGYGQINGTEKKPLTGANRFRIASIGKMHTAVMILQLVDEQKLKLTDTLDKFLPQVPNAGKITILQMLSHRSGIPNMHRTWDPQRNWTNGITKDEILALIVKAAPDFEPDSKQSYSNSGYFILTLILEKITGKSYAEALKERIISKIGLAETYTATGFLDANKNESLTYIHFGGDWQPVRETHPSIAYGAGQIMSTPNDLAKFIQALFDGKLVSKESLDRMKTIRDGEGLGIIPFTYAGKTFYGATGGGDNYGSWLVYEPEEKLAVAYTTNAKIYPVANIVSGAIDIYYNKPFQIPALESVAVNPDVLDRYVGVYSAPGAPAKATVTRDGGTLYFQPPGAKSAVPLEATAEDKFQIEGAAVFTFDAAKNQMTVKRRGGGERVFTKEK